MSQTTHKKPASHAAALACALLCLFLGACSSVRKSYEKNASYTLAEPGNNNATQLIVAQLARQPPGYSGFRLLALSTEALTARLALIEQAVSSLDVQYYMFHDDATGRLVAQRLLDAADRGVRVRLLLDDIHVFGNDRNVLALDAHPNIDVRLFNPFKNRTSTGLGISLATQFLIDGRRLNRRMHNKSLIADSHAAIIGGRNIGDEYFDARQDINFRDLDVLAVGPIVGEISSSFDTFWNSPSAYPIDAFYLRSSSTKKLDALRATLRKNVRDFPSAADTQIFFTREFAIEPDDDADGAADPAPPSADPAPRFQWCWGAARLIVDPPDKVETDTPKKGPHIGEELFKILNTTQHQLLLISPYFVPRTEGVELFAGLAARGLDIKILTNSLASTDVAIVHAGYARYRPGILAAGVELYELRALPSPTRKKFFRGKRGGGISLHAKAFVIDEHRTFIGSMNIDPRSNLLNTEMGVLVESPELARAVAGFFNEAIEPDSSYRVHLAEPDADGNRKLYWTGGPAGQTQHYTTDPNASVWRRIKTTFMRLFPIEGLL